jgi:hypothetical protein
LTASSTIDLNFLRLIFPFMVLSLFANLKWAVGESNSVMPAFHQATEGGYLTGNLL